MSVRVDQLLAYVGGQIVIEECREGGAWFCGEIAEVFPVDNNEIRFKMKWMAKSEVERGEWKAYHVLEHTLSLVDFDEQSIGPDLADNVCVWLGSWSLLKRIVLMPAGGGKIHPSWVQGLELPGGAPPAADEEQS
jgi:hypothetical protein